MSQVWIVTTPYRHLLDSCQLRDFDSVFAWSDGNRFDKKGLETWRQRWCITLTDEQATERVYLKRFDHPPLKRQWERIKAGYWTTSTAGIEYNNAQQLEEAGINAAQAVAFGQEVTGCIEQRSFIILREVTGEALERWCPDNLPARENDTAPIQRRQRLDRLARFVGQFHGNGFIHRDLYLSHIFIDTNNDPVGTFALIDLQRVFRPRFRHRRWLIKDLAGLHFSTPTDRVGTLERLRFLCRYAKVSGYNGDIRTLARDIERKTQWMRRRHEKRRWNE